MNGFLFFLVLLIIVVIAIYNSIIQLKHNVDKSESGIDVYLQQRFDLIPNLVEVTKTYMNYESDILENIARLRTAYNQTKDINASNELNNQYKTIMAVIENYPDLKANEQFSKLQKSLVKIESQLRAARRIYNNDVTKYNTKISTFPNNLIANMFGFKERNLFVLDGEDKVNVKF